MTGFGSETAIQFNLEPRTQRRSSLSSMLGIDHGYLTCDARPGCTMAWTAAALTTPPTHYFNCCLHHNERQSNADSRRIFC